MMLFKRPPVILEGERKAADDRILGILKFCRRNFLVPNSLELVHEFTNRAFGDFGADRRLGDKQPAILDREVTLLPTE